MKKSSTKYFKKLNLHLLVLNSIYIKKCKIFVKDKIHDKTINSISPMQILQY